MEIVRKLRAVAVTGGVIALLLRTVTAQASAQPIERAHFHDAGSEVFTDCGIPLLDEWDVMVNIVANAHGPDGLVYFVQSFHGTDTLTNPANGKTFTRSSTTPSRTSR
jgi:hypothetical protein